MQQKQTFVINEIKYFLRLYTAMYRHLIRDGRCVLQEEDDQLVEAANNGGTQPNDDGITVELKTPQAVKFGWIKGVLVRG